MIGTDFERCYRAVQSRDARFDGWFFTAVTSTGIYCRPSCPAMTPKAVNVRFYPTRGRGPGSRVPRVPALPARRHPRLAGMERARRPRRSRDAPHRRRRGRHAGESPELARRLGYSERHLNRQLTAEVGAGPIALARAQRAQTARVLIETTELPFARVAFAAGFSSIRQFNDTIRQIFATTPSDMRSRSQGP